LGNPGLQPADPAAEPKPAGREMELCKNPEAYSFFQNQKPGSFARLLSSPIFNPV
jgi:hypothetical protein